MSLGFLSVAISTFPAKKKAVVAPQGVPSRFWVLGNIPRREAPKPLPVNLAPLYECTYLVLGTSKSQFPFLSL